MTPQKDSTDKRKIKKLKVQEHNKRYANKAKREAELEYWKMPDYDNEIIESLHKRHYISMISMVPKLFIAMVCFAITIECTSKHNELFFEYYGYIIFPSICVIFIIYASYSSELSWRRLNKEINDFEESTKVNPFEGKYFKIREQQRELVHLMCEADPIVLEAFLRSQDSKYRKA